MKMNIVVPNVLTIPLTVQSLSGCPYLEIIYIDIPNLIPRKLEIFIITIKLNNESDTYKKSIMYFFKDRFIIKVLFYHSMYGVLPWVALGIGGLIVLNTCLACCGIRYDNVYFISGHVFI